MVAPATSAGSSAIFAKKIVASLHSTTSQPELMQTEIIQVVPARKDVIRAAWPIKSFTRRMAAQVEHEAIDAGVQRPTTFAGELQKF